MRFLAGLPVGVVAAGVSCSTSTAADFRFLDCWESITSNPRSLIDRTKRCPGGWLMRYVLVGDTEISSMEVCDTPNVNNDMALVSHQRQGFFRLGVDFKLIPNSTQKHKQYIY